MLTIKPRTRIQEGASWEDIQDGDCYETGYEICDENGEIIYDFADEGTKDYYEELNRKEEENTMENRITIESVVDYIVTTTMEETESGNMCTYFDELADHFKVDENFFEENFDAICDGLLSRKEVCDIDGSSIEERVFDINIWLKYCKNYDDADLRNDDVDLRNTADDLIDIFEELLDRLDVTLPDKWREGEEDEARIFGDTYYELENKIVERLRKEAK